MSVVSSTDVDVFQRLSNAAIVDVQERRATNDIKAAIAAAAEPEPQKPKQSTVEPSTVEPSAVRVEARSARSPFGIAVEPRSAFELAKAEAAAEARECARSECSELSEPSAPRIPERMTEPARLQLPRRRPEPLPRVPEVAEPPASSASPESTPRSDVGAAAPGSEAERLEKQGYLIELSNLKQKGVPLSRDFTLRDSIAELEFELKKQQNHATTRQHVTFMRDMLRIGINGLEIGNQRFGPFLSIDGWAESITGDMQKYDGALERLYKRYFRKSQMSPLMELGWLIIGSMMAWHFKSKFLGSPAPQRQQEREQPPARSKQQPKASARARPTLRAPQSLFGR